MDVKIKLSPETYEFLMQQIPEGLITRKALEQAQLIRSRINSQPLTYEFNCDDDVAVSLLRFAQRYCSDAVKEIEFALPTRRSDDGFSWRAFFR